MKKLITALCASAFALAVAVPVASACGKDDSSKVVKKDTEKSKKKVAQNDKKKSKAQD